MSFSAPGVAYLDTSALMKLIVPEPGSAALAHVLAEERLWISSEIIEVEAVRAARRLGPLAVIAARRELLRIDIAPLDDEVRRSAGEMNPPLLRSLDAIHLATAVSMRTAINAVYTYDLRLADAARDIGLAVAAPT